MQEISVDLAKEIRNGEEIDMNNLSSFLLENSTIDGNLVEIKQFPGGFSNLTYLLSTELSEYVLRRPPIGANIKSAHDMAREFKVLTALLPYFKAVPKPIIYCENDAVIGAPFYTMERVNGVILRGNQANNYKFEASQMKTLSEKLVDNLTDLHGIDIESSELKNFGKPEGYVERQVSGWIGRYEKSQTDQIAAMESLKNWLVKNMPKAQKPCFIHNDYKYDNVVFTSDLKDIKAILDWEMATVGDPLMDLGSTLAYWVEAGENDFMKSMNLTWLPGNLNRQQIVDRYAKNTNRDVSQILFYFVFGLFKNAVILQQIYARWKLGITQDIRFGKLIDGVKELSQMGTKAIDKQTI